MRTRLPEENEDELKGLGEVLRGNISINNAIIKAYTDLNYRTVMWSSAYDDWDKERQNREEYGKKKILENMY